jgi:hypothetical protein
MPTDYSQIEMLNIFVGFEQTNKYAISVLPFPPRAVVQVNDALV